MNQPAPPPIRLPKSLGPFLLLPGYAEIWLCLKGLRLLPLKLRRLGKTNAKHMKTPKTLPIPNQKKKQIISVRPSGSQPIQKLTEQFAPHSTNSCGKGYFYLEILSKFSPGKGVWGGRYNVLRNKKSRSNPEFFFSSARLHPRNHHTLGYSLVVSVFWDLSAYSPKYREASFQGTPCTRQSI